MRRVALARPCALTIQPSMRDWVVGLVLFGCWVRVTRETHEPLAGHIRSHQVTRETHDPLAGHIRSHQVTSGDIRSLICSRSLSFAHLLSLAKFCSPLLSFAFVCPICSHLLSLAVLCSRLLSFAFVCSHLLSLAVLCFRKNISLFVPPSMEDTIKTMCFGLHLWKSH